MKKSAVLLAVVPLLALAASITLLVRGHTVSILSPAGPVGAEEKDLIAFAFFLGLGVIIPVFILLIIFAVKYSEDNPKSKHTYRPEWSSSRLLETIWWGIPCAIILVLSVVTWKTSHSLEPSKPLKSANPAITVQAVALDWKWLFIYPNQDIATVNYLRIPTHTPIHFELTSDAPMNSLWIPQLGSQIYNMPGMSTQVSLEADKPGVFYGSSANISGEGFAGMHFNTTATSRAEFDAWVHQAKMSSTMLDSTAYASLEKPSKDVLPATFSSVDHNLYGTIVMKYMSPGMTDTAHSDGAPKTMQMSGMSDMKGMN